MKIQVEENGKIVLPSRILREWNLEKGSFLQCEIKKAYIRLAPCVKKSK